MTGIYSARAARLVARIWSIASIAFVLIFVIADGAGERGSGPTPREWFGIALFPVGVCVGLVLGWFREGLGGAIATCSLISFYLWLIIAHGQLPRGPYFLLVALPGILFIISWFLSRTEQRDAVS